MAPLISFLIPTMRERSQKFKSLTDKIFLQIEEHNLQEEVEVLSIYDNRNIRLCDKRNMMQKLCRGMYFLHLDDDDRIADDYCITVVNEIKELIKKSPLEGGDTVVPDCIMYNQMAEVNGQFFIVRSNPMSNMGLNKCGNIYQMNDGNIPVYERIPWQYHLWNKAKFSHIYRTDVDTNAREDQNWLKKVILEYDLTNVDLDLHLTLFISLVYMVVFAMNISHMN